MMKAGESSTAVGTATEKTGDEAALVIQAALKETAALVGLAFLFCTGVFWARGPEAATSWLSAYILEQSLSVDNLLVFTMIFDYFQTPADAQPRVLRWGLIVAAALRAAFIFAGLAAVERFQSVLLVFAGVLLYSSAKLLFEGEDEEEDLSNNKVVQWTKRYLPSSDEYDGDRFITSASPASPSPDSTYIRVSEYERFVAGASGRTGAEGAARAEPGSLIGLLKGTSVVTPLLLALVCVEISDVIFAVDSIPAVFGVTKDPFIAFTSNTFAILGLRSLYPLVSRAVTEFEYLQPAIALVLGFIGAKLIGEYMGVEVSTVTSLAVVASTLGAGVGASVFLNKGGVASGIMEWRHVKKDDAVLTLWPGREVNEKNGADMLSFFQDTFGIVVTPVGCVTTLPDKDRAGLDVPGTGGRPDFFFYVDAADLPKFGTAILTRKGGINGWEPPFGMRWWQDVYYNHGEDIYPASFRAAYPDDRATYDAD